MIPDSKKTVYFLKRHPRILAGFLTVIVIVAGLVYWKTAFGVTRTWDGGGGDNNWNTPENWSGDTTPGNSDIAVFDGTSSKNVTINSNLTGILSPAGISINAGYGGTITQATGVTITVGASGFTQSAGTFTGGNSAISNSGDFTLSGGTFASTSGTFSAGGNWTHTAGGTFSHSNGTVTFARIGSLTNFNIDISTTETFYNLSININYSTATFNIATGDTLIVLGTFTRGDGAINTGTIEVRGDTIVGTQTSGVGSGTISFPVAGDQTITGNGGTLPAVTISKPSGNLSATGNFSTYGFTLSSGTFTSTSGTLSVCGNWTHTAGGTFNHNSGTVTFISSSACSINSTINTSPAEVFYNLTDNMIYDPSALNITGTIISLNTFTHTDGAINTGTIEVRGNVVIGAGAQGGTAALSFLNTADQTITGSAGGVSPELNINKSSGGLSAFGSFGVYGFTLSSGTFTNTSGTLSVGKSWTHTGGTFNHNNGTVIFVYYYPSTSITVNVSSPETFYNLTSNNNFYPTDLTITGTLIVLNNFSHLYARINTGTIEARGNVVIGASADGGTATLSFTGPNDQTYTDQGGNEPNGNITINKPVGTVLNLASNADWNAAGQTTTITSGILNIGSYTLYTGGTLTVGANGVLHSYSTGDLVLGGAVSNSGIIRLESSGSCGSTDAISITSSVGGTQRAWSGSGVYTLWDTSIQDQGGTAKIQVNSGTSVSGNGTNFVFNSACNFTNNNTSLTNGLVGYWPMEENVGTTTADMSGNGNAGTLTLGPTWTTGKIGYGVNFDGTDDYISTADIDYGAGNSISVSAWIKFTTCGNDGYCYIVAKSLFMGDTPYTLYTVTAGNICFTVNTAVSQVCSSGTYNDGTWHYAVATFDGSTGIIYVDGVNVANLGFSPTSNNNVVTISDSGRKFTGTIDEVRIYNRALSAEEVRQLYNNVRPSSSTVNSGVLNFGSGTYIFQ